MYVCLCHGVNEATIKELVEQGMHSASKIKRASRAGTCCGRCCEKIQEIIHDLCSEGNSSPESQQ